MYFKHLVQFLKYVDTIIIIIIIFLKNYFWLSGNAGPFTKVTLSVTADVDPLHF